MPVLVVAGSMSEATRRQVDKALCQDRAKVVDIDASRLASAGFEQEIASVVEQACALLSRHHHTTQGGVNVLNLVEGAQAVVDSPSGAFAPFIVHYAETFIIPAAVGEYRISPSGDSVDQPLATIKAWVRG